MDITLAGADGGGGGFVGGGPNGRTDLLMELPELYRLEG